MNQLLFDHLAQEYEEQTMFYSTHQLDQTTLAYQQLFAAGIAVVPFILDHLAENPSMAWQGLLADLTGASPDSAGQTPIGGSIVATNVGQAAELWRRGSGAVNTVCSHQQLPS